MGGVGGQGRGPGGRGGALGHPWLRVGSTFLPSAGFVRQDWLGGDQGGLDRTDPARFGAGAPGGGLVLTAQGCCRGTRQRLTSSPRAQTSRILGHVSLSFPHHHERTWLQRRSWDWLKN